ncbi:hypothetical protein FXO38_34122 [Capsicum annuum]|nr:hypothetical protein FXO37_36201 [Capsicum annuum]KAF3617191.1 hypothetical protein FXO38_34122 [Capsicum annuum]
MESELEAVRDKKTGAVLFYTKRCLPFKTAHRPVRASKPKNNPVDVVLPSKNVQVMSNFRKAASVAEVNSSACTKAKNNLVDVVLPSKNVQLMSDFRKAAADAGVMLDFGDGDYGFWDNLRSLEKEFPSYLFEKEKSKFWGEVARLRGLGESIEDSKNLSRDVYNLSVMEEMLDDFKKENLS